MSPSPKRVLLLIPRGAEVLETAAFFDVIGWANTYGSVPIEVTTVGLEREVRCTFGLRVLPDRQLNEVEPAEFDALALPGGFEEHGFYEHAFSDEVSALIRGFEERARPICSICVGALPIAKSGVLDGRRATTYHLAGGRRDQLADMGVDVVDAAIVRDGNIVTSTSPATAVDVALELLEALTTAENAAEIRRLMGFSPKAENRNA